MNASPCRDCSAAFCGGRNADRDLIAQQLAQRGVIGVRPAALTGVTALLFALPIVLLVVLLPALTAQSAWIQLLAIVSVVSLAGLLGRWQRRRLLQWLLIRPGGAQPVERLRAGRV